MCIRDRYLIDLGADFRLEKPEDYEEWYQLSYQKPELHKLCAYVIPELHRSLAKGCKIIANPGCYPTSIGLGLAPILPVSYTHLDVYKRQLLSLAYICSLES